MSAWTDRYPLLVLVYESLTFCHMGIRRADVGAGWVKETKEPGWPRQGRAPRLGRRWEKLSPHVLPIAAVAHTCLRPAPAESLALLLTISEVRKLTKVMLRIRQTRPCGDASSIQQEEHVRMQCVSMCSSTRPIRSDLAYPLRSANDPAADRWIGKSSRRTFA